MTEMRAFSFAEWLQPQRLIQMALRSPLGALATSRVIDGPTLIEWLKKNAPPETFRGRASTDSTGSDGCAD